VVEAEIIKGRLETEGIPAFVADETSGGIMPFIGSSSGVRVQVAAVDAERAKEILSST
jgi:hypothetical protein